MEINQLIENMPGWQGVILLGLAVLVFSCLYVWLLGKARILAILIATYISFAFVSVFTRLALFNLSDFYIFLIFISGVLLFGFVLSFSHSIYAPPRGFVVWRLIQGTVFAIIQVGLLVSLGLRFALDSWVEGMPYFIEKLFLSPFASLVWFLLPFLVLLVFRSRHRGPGRPRVF